MTYLLRICRLNLIAILRQLFFHCIILCTRIKGNIFRSSLFLDRTHIEKYSSFFCINKTKVPSHLYPTLIMASLLLGQSMTVYCQVHDILILNTYLKLDRLVSNK